MHALVLAARYVNDILFAVLALVALRAWRQRRDPAAGWAAATFLVLAGVAIAGLFVPEDVDGGLLAWVQKLLVVVLVLFPYFLHRFAAVFEPPGRRIDHVATVMTGALIVGTFALPRIPGPGEARPGWFTAYIAVLLVQWTGLSVLVTVRLWRGGQGKPTVARRRMRVLSLASALLNLALILAGTAPTSAEETAITVVVQLLATASALLFFAGVAPPGFLRLSWRRPEEEALQVALLRLLAATTAGEVTVHLLPPVTGVLGGSGAALVDREGAVVGRYGTTPATIPEAAAEGRDGLMRLEMQAGTLLVWTSPHTPYFGREELVLFRSFGVVADLALGRCQLLERQRQAAEHLEQANQHLHREVQERTAVVERLGLSEQRLREAQAMAHTGGWDWDLDSGKIVWSEELYRIYGLEPHTEVNRQDLVERIHPDDREAARVVVERALTDQSPFSLESRIVRPDGSLRVVHSQGKTVVDEKDGRRHLLGTGQDVTERKATEEALHQAYGREREARMAFEQTNDELESFVYSVSHDLKSPMISLLGYLDYFKLDFGQGLPDDALHYLDRMAASGAYMQALIQDLLDLSRVGRSQIEPERVDLAAVMAEVMGEVRSSHPGVSVEVGPLPVLWMNPVRVRQLLTNLLGNAGDHAGRPTVHVLVTSETGPDGSVVVSVADDGPGIPAAYREKVFGVFERLNGNEGSGTGIGLAICRKIMQSAGGSITVADSESGTTMCASFPAQVVRKRPAVGSIGVGSRL